jgi:hypothetical protein
MKRQNEFKKRGRAKEKQEIERYRKRKTQLK